MKIYNIGLFLVLSVLFASCDLDREPQGRPKWSNQESLQKGLDAAYAPFYEEEGYGRGHLWALGVSDDMVYNRIRANEDPLANFTDAGATNNSGGFRENWNLMFRSVRSANDVLKYAPEIQIEKESDRNIIEGEANFLAAYGLFYLAKRYGGLPFYDPINKPLEVNPARETKTQTYTRIENYLLESIRLFEKNNLWERDGASLGRPALGAAYGLLAKVYAHWGHYDKAKIAAEKVINSGKFSLNTTGGNGYANLFSPAGEKHNEVLFNLVSKPMRNQSTIISILTLSGKMTGGTGWYYFAPTQSLSNAYDNGDLRRTVTIKGIGDKVSYRALIGTKIPQTKEEEEAGIEAKKLTEQDLPLTLTSLWLSDMSTGYMCTKFAAVYEDLKDWTWYTGADQPLLRYADVLLIHAEAEIFLAGGGANNRDLGVVAAAKSFNQVRERAFGNDASKAIAAPTFNDLVKERRCELAYEDDRHFDLVRWGLAKEVYGKGKANGDPRGDRTFDPAKHAHFPIPQQEIENSNYVLINNPAPGYSTFE